MKGERSTTGLALAVLGVVYGDIGTSPLYAFKVAVGAAHVPGLPKPVTGTEAVAEGVLDDGW